MSAIGTTLDQEIVDLHKQGYGQKLIARKLSEQHEIEITQTNIAYRFKKLGLKPHIGSSNGGMAIAAKFGKPSTAIEKQVEDYHRTQKRNMCEQYAGFKDLPLFTNANVFKSRYRNEPTFRMKSVLRRRIRKGISSRGYKPRSLEIIQSIGCSAEELKAHIESQFTEGMTWQNMGEWHVDHIVPLASIKATSESDMIEQMIKLSHYTNLQPLWACDNLAKGSSMPTLPYPPPL